MKVVRRWMVVLVGVAVMLVVAVVIVNVMRRA